MLHKAAFLAVILAVLACAQVATASRSSAAAIRGGDRKLYTVPPGYSFFTNMYEAGKLDGTKRLISKAYKSVDCSTNTVCFIVVVEPGFFVVPSPGDSWFKDYERGQNPVTPLGGINYISENGLVIGWQGCFPYIPPGSSSIELHARFGPSAGAEPDDGTTSTGKKPGIPIIYSCDGGGYGDPHLKTWKGKIYDFHGECDLVLVHSEKLDLDVHIRTVIHDDWSYIAATAIRIGNDIVEIGSHGTYALNGESEAPLDFSAGGYPSTFTHVDARRHVLMIDMGAMGKIVVKVFNEFLAVRIEDAHPDGFGHSVGLMGDYETGHLVNREGSVVMDTNAFGMDWQVLDTEPMLFQQVKGPQYPELCNMPTAKSMTSRRLSESLVSFEVAAKACEDWPEESKESCIYDVMATGDLEMAQAGAF